MSGLAVAGCASADGGGGGTAGTPIESMRTAGVSTTPTPEAIRIGMPADVCTSQYSVGWVPRAKYSVYTIERDEMLPSALTDTTSRHRSVANLPDRRHTVAVDTPDGGDNHSGLSPFVADFMNAVHIGTATSAANPFGRIVRG